MSGLPSKGALLDAHRCIAPYVHRTPIMHATSMDNMLGCTLYFKCENLQRTGSFKLRGATNALLNTPSSQLAHGVATHSSGNHGQALALAARTAGVKAYIVMPHNASSVKREAVAAFGGQIVDCANSLSARENTLSQVLAKTGAFLVHPFNNYDVIAGQASATLELIEDIEQTVDYLFVPVGGGGLLSGALLATTYLAPSIKVIAGEPLGADDAFRSLQTGNIESSQADTIADGLVTSLSEKTFGIIKDRIECIVTVTEQEIVKAMQLVWGRLKVVVEPSAVVGLAALIKTKKNYANKRIGIILSGGNIDISRLADWFVF